MFVKGFGGNSEKAFEAVGRILEGNPQVIILCDEIGCGIVPMEKEEREYRELVGRIMGMVVSRAQRVERLVCGIPQVLKGDGKVEG